MGDALKRTRGRYLDGDISSLPNFTYVKSERRPPSAKPVTLFEDHGPSLSSVPSALRGREFITDENHGVDYEEVILRHQHDIADDNKNDELLILNTDVGGDMDLIRSGIFASSKGSLHRVTRSASVDTFWDYYGPILATNPINLSLPPYTDDNLDTLGTEAIKRIKPTNNVSNLAVDLAEARSEGLPALPGVSSWEARTSVAKAAGSEYLNKVFGWDPLVGDIRDACYAAANAHKILESYQRNSHKLVRRRYEFPVVDGTVDSLYAANVNPFTGSGNANAGIFLSPQSGDVIRTRRTYKRTWFSGAFTYHLPPGFTSGNPVVSAASKAGPLLGIELTPEVVWNATPWTWALNWVSDVGDLVSNISDMIVDGLVMKYGYIMQHQVVADTYTYVGPINYQSGSISADFPASVTAFVERKRRKRATPFGFGLSFSGFSPRQLAIIAALGFSRR